MKITHVFAIFTLSILQNFAYAAITEKLWTCNETPIDLKNQPAIEETFSARRADSFLPLEKYAEPGFSDPSKGARVSLVIIASQSGEVREVSFNNIDLFAAEQQGTIDWVHVWPKYAHKGDAVWISFHAQNSSLTNTEKRAVKVTGTTGTLFAGTTQVVDQPIRINYVTTSNQHKRVHIFVENKSGKMRHVRKLFLNGRDVTQHACMPLNVIKDNGVQTYFVSLTQPLNSGSPYGVVVDFEDAPPAIGVGRIIPEVFVNDAWTNANENAYPTANNDNFNQIKNLGINTLFLQGDAGVSAYTNPQRIIDALRSDGLWSFIEHDVTPRIFEAYADHIVARHLGDELDAPDDVNKQLKSLAASTRSFWNNEPSIPTFVGGSRNRKNGRFAGVTDIQGMDFYTAACAPHVTSFLKYPAIRGSFDYARVARNNQKPNSTWIYTQGFSGAWSSQPSAAELKIQAASIVAAGSKGLMWFQTSIQHGNSNLENRLAWKALQEVNQQINSIGTFIRTSDPDNSAFSTNNDMIVQSLVGENFLLIFVINTKVLSKPNDIHCLITGKDNWILDTLSANITVDIPYDIGVDAVLDVQPDGRMNRVQNFKQTVRRLEIPVQLSDNEPFKIFLLK